jgi:hypothetical protein
MVPAMVDLPDPPLPTKATFSTTARYRGTMTP